MANIESDEAKEDRLQIRMKPELKEWFRTYSENRGGMSEVVLGYIRRLRKKDRKDDADNE